jgi:hypothetical protein
MRLMILAVQCSKNSPLISLIRPLSKQGQELYE